MIFLAFPFVRLLLAFVAGILLYQYFPIEHSAPSIFYWLLTLPALLLLEALLKPIGFRKMHPYLGLGACIWLIGLGHLLSSAQFQQDNPKKATFRQMVAKKCNAYKISILELGNTSTGKKRLIGQLLAVELDSQWQQTVGRALLYLPNSGIDYSYGDTLLIMDKLQVISPPANPKAFDYAAFMAQQQVYLQGFPQLAKIRITGKNNNYSLSAITWQTRQYIDSTLRAYLPTEAVYGIASALVLGTKAHLSNDWKQQYAQAGAMHVLAVSGLHVGLVMGVMAWFLRRWRTTWWAFLLQLGLLWSYAMLTGMSASVLRAATMFSIILIGYTWRKSHNIANTLAVSAFLLLCVDVQLLFHIGFQLSYAAVLGIVYLQPSLERFCHRKWPSKHWLWSKIISLTTVSIAAQLATLPISLYYFHQFPSYFLLSNFIVIPLAGIILPLGILLIATSFWHSLAGIVAMLLSWSIQLMNEGIGSLRYLPYHYIANIPFDIWMLVLSYALLFCLVAFLVQKKHYYLWGVFVCCLTLAIYKTVICNQHSKQYELWAYSAKQSPLLILNGGNAQYFPILNEQQKNWTFTNHLLSKQIREVQFFNDYTHTPAWQKGPHLLLAWKGHSIINIANDTLRHTLPKADIYLTNHQSTLHIPNPNATVVLGYDLTWKARHSWINYLDNKGIKYHDLRTKAFSLIPQEQ